MVINKLLASNISATRTGPAEQKPVDERFGWLPSLLPTILFVLTFAGLTWLVCGQPVYETCDDVTMSMISSGMGMLTRPDDHLIYSHFLIGRLLNQLYLLSNQFPWYASYLLLSQLIAMVVVVSLLSTRSKQARTDILAGSIFLVAICVRPLELLQFTTTSALVASAASLLLLSGLEPKKPHSKQVLVLAFVLFGLSAMIRADSSKLILLLTTLVLFARYFGSFDWRHLAKGLAAILIASGLVVAVDMSNISYHSQGDWQGFFTTKKVRHELLDFGRTWRMSAATKKALDEIGWSENDLAIFNHWYIMDSTTFSTDKLQKLNSLLPAMRSDLYPGWQRYHLSRIVGDVTVIPMLFVILGSMFCLTGKEFPIRSGLLYLVAVSVLMYALIVCWRLPPRLYAAILSFSAIVFLWYASQKETRRIFTFSNWRKGLAIVSVIAPILILQVLCYRNASAVARNDSAEIVSAVKELDPSADQLYIFWANSYSAVMSKVLPFQNLRSYLPENFNLVLTSTPSISPLTTSRLRAWGVRNLLADIDGNGIFLICDDSINEIIRQYIREHYEKNANFHLVYERPEIALRVYKVQLTDKPLLLDNAERNGK